VHGISTNDASTQELSYEIGAISAEVAGGGVRVNIIPKEGGNRFSGSGSSISRTTAAGRERRRPLRSQDITTADSILKIYDGSFAIGGPLKRTSCGSGRRIATGATSRSGPTRSMKAISRRSSSRRIGAVRAPRRSAT
jgi:hypothetical protein